MLAIVGQQVILGRIQTSIPVEPHIILPFLSLSLSRSFFMFICFMCFFNVLFFCQQNKFSPPNYSSSKIYTKNIYLHTFFMRLNCFKKLLCSLALRFSHRYQAVRTTKWTHEIKKRQWFIAVFHSIRFLFIPFCCNLTCKYFSPLSVNITGLCLPNWKIYFATKNYWILWTSTSLKALFVEYFLDTFSRNWWKNYCTQLFTVTTGLAFAIKLWNTFPPSLYYTKKA